MWLESLKKKYARLGRHYAAASESFLFFHFFASSTDRVPAGDGKTHQTPYTHHRLLTAVESDDLVPLLESVQTYDVTSGHLFSLKYQMNKVKKKKKRSRLFKRFLILLNKK